MRLEELEAARDKQRSKRSFAREGFLETPRHNTLQSLKKERWETARPHSSYDMDGDGVVSPRDYFIAKMFSGDPKHKHNHMLSPVERSQALEAVAKGLGNHLGSPHNTCTVYIEEKTTKNKMSWLLYFSSLQINICVDIDLVVGGGLGKDSMETYFSFKQKAAPLTRVQNEPGEYDLT